ncbi:MAG: ABC transporter ATP-binding protein [Spirochaetaceae bacterium]|nr:MAG: ABC transporter ATP-binding protein [Spirochaetaceae bacterium]
MIELDDVRRVYDDFSLTLCFSVADDEILALLGSSGSGKTTTLRIIAGFERLDSGRLLINGVDMADVSPQQREIGYVFQDYTLFPHLNVEQNVAYGLRVAAVAPLERRRRVAELLEMVDLAQFGKRAVHTLSGGEQQRVAVARALARKPRALLLDEPFSAIDSDLREDLRRHLMRVQRALRVPTIFVTHSRTEALSVGDRIIVLRAGAIDDQGTPQQLYQRPRTAYTARFLGRANIIRTAQLSAYGFGTAGGGDQTSADAELLMIRPEHVVLRPAEQTAETAEAAAVTFPARVVRSTYHGLYREYELETAIGPLYAVSNREFSDGSSLVAGFPPSHLTPVAPDALR